MPPRLMSQSLRASIYCTRVRASTRKTRDASSLNTKLFSLPLFCFINFRSAPLTAPRNLELQIEVWLPSCPQACRTESEQFGAWGGGSL